MFILNDTLTQRAPIKIWLKDISEIEEKCLNQARNISNLPFLYKWLNLLPDCHEGYGMPIGGVLATKDVIIPYAVGSDIGCGMIFQGTNIPAPLLRETIVHEGSLLKEIIRCVFQNVPTGFSSHKEPQVSPTLDKYYEKFLCDPNSSVWKLSQNDDELCELIDEIENAYYQIGTLGSGNHFTEVQCDEEDNSAIMIHTGSRNLGYKICDFFNKKAIELNSKWYSNVPRDYELAFLPTDDIWGKAYIEFMQLALEFAQENRVAILNRVKSIFLNLVKKHTNFTGIELQEEINAHHNFAALENHFGQNVWVHRKGAIRARIDELGIIPGAMGSFSYIVKGQGNSESFMSCSHGAGRKMGRKAACRKFTTEETLNDLKTLGVELGKSRMEDVAEETRFAYKNINDVIQNELDLIVAIKKLKTMGVIKG